MLMAEYNITKYNHKDVAHSAGGRLDKSLPTVPVHLQVLIRQG